MTGKIAIRPLTEADWPAAAAIYNQGILSGHATFERACPDYAVWDATHLKACRLALTENDQLAAWAALAPVSRREAYSGVASASLYVRAGRRGRGYGSLLLDALCRESEKAGIWTVQSIVFRENTPGIRLCEKYGFRTVGWREKIAKDAAGRWRDTVVLERRSRIGLEDGPAGTAR